MATEARTELEIPVFIKGKLDVFLEYGIVTHRLLLHYCRLRLALQRYNLQAAPIMRQDNQILCLTIFRMYL